MKNKGWIIFGIFVVAIIIAFAIYKSLGSTNTVISTSGGTQTNSTNGIGSIVDTIKGFFTSKPIVTAGESNADYSNVA